MTYQSSCKQVWCSDLRMSEKIGQEPSSVSLSDKDNALVISRTLEAFLQVRN